MKKKLGPKLGVGKAMGLHLYEQVVHGPTREAVDDIRRQFMLVMLEYLGRFKYSELYRATSCWTKLTTTSQGAEIQMSASLKNRLRACKSQKMLSHVLLTQRTAFLKRQVVALSCGDPVPPFFERHIASLITRSRVYQSTVEFL